MSFIIFQTEKEALQLVSKLDAQLKERFEKRKTDTYAKPRKHPYLELYAIRVKKEYMSNFDFSDLKNVQELDETWIHKIKK